MHRANGVKAISRCKRGRIWASGGLPGLSFVRCLLFISIRAKFQRSRPKTRVVAEPEAFTQQRISLIPKTAIPSKANIASLLGRSASHLDQRCFSFGHVSEIAGKLNCPDLRTNRCECEPPLPAPKTQSVRTHDEAPPVAAMCVNNPDRSPLGDLGLSPLRNRYEIELTANS